MKTFACLFALSVAVSPPCLAGSPAKTSKAKHKTSKKTVAKRSTPTTIARVPASVEEPAQVFNESTSFEELLSKREQIQRDPASIKPVARVIAVKRELGLDSASSDKAVQDVILNAGTSGGLSEGMSLSLVRKVPVIDPYKENKQLELEVEFGSITIIHAQEGLSVGRLERLDSISKGLAVGNRAVMVGDFVTTASR